MREYLNMFSLSMAFHWTPEEIRRQDEDDLIAYKCMANGMSLANKNKDTNNGNIKTKNLR
jgi:hypothetical protein